MQSRFHSWKNLFAAALTAAAVLSVHAGTLMDYGAIPPLTKPAGDESTANQKLIFHTDLFTGRFGYQIPIKVPPARGGTEPSLALQYSSSSKNGWCGMGWTLAFGSIERETRYGIPIPAGGSAYSDADGFTFSFAGYGGRLVGVGNSVYYPQINTDFLKCVYTNGWWMATDKGGRKYYFGETAASRISNSFGIFKWALSSIHDPNGNLTVVTYSADGGQLYLKEIDYNGNTNSPSIATNCTVAFDLESSSRVDVCSSELSGQEIITQKRLQNIRVLNQGQLVRRYNLTYTYSPSTGRSLLHSVTEYGSDNTTALPAHTFGYSVQLNQFTAPTQLPIVSQTFAGDTYGLMPANIGEGLIDINGDGLPDRVVQVNSYPYNSYLVQINNGNGFNAQVAWSPLSEETGDGEIIWNTLDSSLPADSYGNTTSIASLIDINGDGLPDRVARQHNFNSSGNLDHFQIQLNTGSGFGTLHSMTGVNSVYGGVYDAPYARSWDGKADMETLVDVNGDGLPDRVMQGSASGRFDVQLNVGGGSFGSVIAWPGVVTDAGSYPYAPRDWGSPVGGISDIYAEFMDMNGDGLPDRVLYGGAQLNNGHGFDSYQTTWGYAGAFPGVVNVTDGNYTSQMIDMNGDGLPDYVVSNGNGTYTVYFNTGRGFTGAYAIWSNVNINGNGTTGWNNLQSWSVNGTKVMFIDLNGDGLVDRVTQDYTGANSLIVQYNQGPFPDLLNAVTNGIGGFVTVNYQPSTVYRNPDGSPQKMAFPVYVVTSVTANDGRGNAGTTSYTYAGAYYDPSYREFRGFYEVRETDPLGAYSNYFFHQGGGNGINGSAYGEYFDDIAKSGMIFQTDNYGTDGRLYSATLNKVNETLLYNGGSGFNSVYFPFLQQTINLDFEGNNTARSTAVGYAYNCIANNLAASTGNLVGQTNWGEVTNINFTTHAFAIGLPGSPPPVYEQFSYATIPSNPDIIDRVQSATTSSDPAGASVLQQTLYQYFDGTGNLQEKSDLICSSAYATNTYTYDNYGNLATVTDPVGIVSQMNYDSSATFPVSKSTGTLTNFTQFDPRSGVLLNSTNAQGLVTANAYDVFFRLTNAATSTTPNGPVTLWRTRYQYNLGGIVSGSSFNFVRTFQNDPADTVNGTHESDTYLDGLGRPIQIRDESETNGFRVTDLVYDKRGAFMLQNYPLFQSGSGYAKPGGTRTNVWTQFDPIGRVWKVNPCAAASFDGNGWLSGSPVALSGDAGSPTGPVSFDYNDGNNPWALLVTNALGKVHKYYTDAYGRTNQIVEVTTSGNFTTTLNYDLLGNLTNTVDNASNSTSYFFDDLGREVAMADPDMGFWQFARDADGRLKVQTDAKGQQIRLYYSDPAGRLTRREAWTAAGQCVSTNTWQYDSNAGDSSCTVYPGQLYAVTDDEGWQKFSYDVRNRTLKSVRYLTKNGNLYTNLFSFDDADRLTATVYPNGGPVITNIFDLGGNLSQVKQVGGTTFYAARGFNAMRQLLGINFGNGVVTTNSYYPVSLRLQKIVTFKTTNLQNLAYTFDATGNVKSITDGVYSGPASATFGNISYDDLNRLTALTNASGSFTYGFDSVGNVLTNGETGTGNYTYGTIRPHCVRTANGVSYTYDLNGNVSMRGSQHLFYDANNRLSLVWGTNGLKTSFGYAADGSRLWEQSGTNPLQVWMGNNYEEKNGLILFHVIADGRSVCTFDQTGTNVFEYYHPDNLASTSIQTDQNGNEIQNYGYSAFGQSRYTQSATVFKVSRRYTGQVLDEATGLYWYNSRPYDPVLARFTQPDSIIPDLFNPQTYNRYAYCVNNPLRYTDPTGHDFVLNAGLVAGPVPYLTAKSTLGQLGAGFYNVFPLVDNSIHQGLRAVAAVDNAAGNVLQTTTLAVTGDPQLAENSRNLTLLIGGVGEVGKIAKVDEAVVTAEKATETVQRAMSKAELQATKDTGLLRGGREGTHYASDAVDSDANRAQQMLSLPNKPEVKATLEVPSGTFSAPSKVEPKFGMPGGGTERTATGKIPVTIKKVEELK